MWLIVLLASTNLLGFFWAFGGDHGEQWRGGGCCFSLALCAFLFAGWSWWIPTAHLVTVVI